MDIVKLREEICLIGRKMYAHKLVAANDGNISCRLDNGLFLITPARLCKGELAPDDLLIVDSRLNVIDGKADRVPSTESKVHLSIYRTRPDLGGVVHTHSPMALAFAMAHVPIMKPAVPSIYSFVGPVPLAEYATPSSPLLADIVAKYIKDYDCMFLANHGAVTAGKNLRDAFYKAERLELLCTATLAARALGGEQNFTDGEIELLEQKKARQIKEGLD